MEVIRLSDRRAEKTCMGRVSAPVSDCFLAPPVGEDHPQHRTHALVRGGKTHPLAKKIGAELREKVAETFIGEGVRNRADAGEILNLHCGRGL